MKCKTGLFLIGLIIVFLLINATKGPKREAREEHDENPLFPQNAATDEDPLKCSPSQAAVGEDVTLDFHFEPELDVTERSVEWNFKKSLSSTSARVLVYKARAFSENDQHKQFKGRASLDNSGNIKEGKLQLKISKVTKDDAGIYSCTVRYKQKKTNSCSTKLIANPEENRNRGIQTDKKTEGNENNNNNNNNNKYYGFIALIIPVIAIVAIVVWRRCGNNNAGADGRGRQELI